MEGSSSMEFDEFEMDSFYKDIALEFEIDSCSRPDRIPKEKIQKSLNDLKNMMISLHPADADEPENRAAIHEAVQFVSKLDRSDGLTDGQIEKLARLVTDWSPIVNRAVEANKTKQEALEERNLWADRGREVGSRLRDLAEREGRLKEEFKKLDLEAGELRRRVAEQRNRSEEMKRKRDSVKIEKGQTFAEARKIKDEYDQIKVDSPNLDEKLEEVTRSIERANREWVALKDAVSAVSV